MSRGGDPCPFYPNPGLNCGKGRTPGNPERHNEERCPDRVPESGDIVLKKICF